MTDIEKNILSVLLESVLKNELITETVYRNSLDKIRTFDDTPLYTYSDDITKELGTQEVS